MRSPLFPSLLLLTTVALSAADAPSISGKWNVHNSISGNESDMACVLTQKEHELTGSCNSDQGTVQINGTVDASNVAWTYKSEYNGGPITLTYKGKLDSASKMTGTVNVAEYGVDGDFTATQSK